MQIEYLGPVDAPANYDEQVKAAALKHGVDPDLAVAVHHQEYNPKQWVGSSGERGPMQLMPGTAKELGVDPDDALQNIDGGVRYLKQQLDSKKSVPLALASYNAGPNAVKDKVPESAQGYVADVQKKYDKIASPQGGPKIEYLGPIEESKDAAWDLLQKDVQARKGGQGPVIEYLGPITEEAAPEKKGFFSDTEPIKAKTVRQYITETIPRSAKNLAIGVATMPYQAGKTAIQGYQESVKAQEAASTELHTLLDKKTLNAQERARAKSLMYSSLQQIPIVKGLEKAGTELIKGLVQFQGAPVGLMGWQEFTKAWYERPVESLAAVLPMAKMFLKGRGIARPTDVQAKALVDAAVKNPEAPEAQAFIKEADQGLRDMPQDAVGPPQPVTQNATRPPEGTIPEKTGQSAPLLPEGGVLAYHGTDQEFETFDRRYLGRNTDEDPNRQAIARLGHWFNTEKDAVSDRYGNAKPFYLDIKNPKEFSLTDLFYMDPGDISTLRKELIAEGYDGLKIFDTEFGGYSYVPFSNKQIIKAQPSFSPSSSPEGGAQIPPKSSTEIAIAPPEATISEKTVEGTPDKIVQMHGGGPETGPFLKRSAQEIADAAREIPGKAQRAAAVVSDAASRVWDWYKAPAPAWTNFKDILGKYLGARNVESYENWEFTKSIVDAVPDRMRQEGITNWLQADGNKELLMQRSAASAGKLKRGYDAALDLSPDEIQVAGRIREYYDRMAKEAIDAGVMEHAIDNYVTQIWKKDNPVSRKLRSETNAGLLNTNFQFARKRIFDSYFEGEQSGYSPKEKSVTYLAAKYHQSMYEAIAARKFIKELSEGKASDGRPLMSVSGGGKAIGPEGTTEAYLIRPRTSKEGTFDYRVIDHPALRDWKWIAKDGEGKPMFLQGDMRVHPEAYTHLKNVLGKSAIRENPVGHAVLTGVQNFKSTLLSLSGFHQVQEGLHAVFHRVNPFNAPDIDFKSPLQRELVDHGLMIADHNALAQFSEGLTSSGLINKLPVIGELSQKYGEYLFKDYIPRLKMAMATHAFERNMGRYGNKLSRDQILEMTAKQADAAFGELNYKMIGRNPTLQDSLRLLTLAPDFLEARLKFVGQAFAPGGKEQATALLRGALGMYAVGAIGNQIINGAPHWNRPFTLEVNGKDYTLRSIPGDMIHLLRDPRSFVYNRLNPTIVRTMIEYVTSRDRFGRRRDLGEQAKDFFTTHIPIPLQGLVNKREQTLLDSALQSLGVANYKHKSNAEQLMADLAQQGTKVDLSPQDRARSDRKWQLTELWDDGKKDRFKAELNTALADKVLTPKQATELKRELNKNPLPRRFEHRPIEDEIKIYKVATPEEKKVLGPILRKKFSRSHEETRRKLWPEYKGAFAKSD